MKLSKQKPKARSKSRLMRDDRWLARHGLEIQRKYHGKAVAIWRNRVIAVGRNAVDVAGKADKVAPPDQWLLLCLNYERVDA